MERCQEDCAGSVQKAGARLKEQLMSNGSEAEGNRVPRKDTYTAAPEGT